LIYLGDVPDNLGTFKHGRKVFKVRSRNVGCRWNRRINLVASEKVVYESVFKCRASHEIIPPSLSIGPASYGNDW
jgi:hypothetical protein